MSKNKTSYFLVLLLVIISAFVTHRHIRSGFDPESGSDYDELLVYTLSYEFFYADEISYNLVGYPPIIVGLNALAYREVASAKDDWSQPYKSETINIVRQWTLIPAIFTALFIFFIGKSLKSDLIGFFSALLWIVLPTILFHRTVALTESWQMLFIAFSLLATLYALKHESPYWAIAAVVGGLLAVTAKYSAFPILGLPVGAVFWLGWFNWRKWLWVGVFQFALIGLVAWILFFLYGASSLIGVGREATTFVTGGRHTNIQTLVGLFSVAIRFVLPTDVLGVLVFGVFLPVYFFNATRWQKVFVGLTAITVVSQVVVTLFYINYPSLSARYLSPMSVPLAVLVVVALEAFANEFGKWMSRSPYRRAFAQRLMFNTVTCLVIVLMGLPTLAILLIPNYTYPRIEPVVMTWVSGNLADTVLLPEKPIFMRFYFDDRYLATESPLPPYMTGDIQENSLEMWDEEGVHYALLFQQNLDALLSTSEGRAYVEELILVEHFEAPSDKYSGEDIYIYSLNNQSP